MTNFFNKIKRKKKFSLYWCLNDKFNWQEGTESWQRGTHTQSECLRTCIMHAGLQSYVCGKTSTHKHTTPPTLPTHCLTWQIRMSASLLVFDFAGICHISVRASRGFTSRQRKALSPSFSSSLRPSPPSCRSPCGAEIGSRSQHHMLHNSQSSDCNCQGFHKTFSDDVHVLILNKATSYV